jgi:MAP/microtubule affinity-regulating kinase
MARRIDEYTLGRTLGQGSYGKVKIGTRADGQRFALKYSKHSN